MWFLAVVVRSGETEHRLHLQSRLVERRDAGGGSVRQRPSPLLSRHREVRWFCLTSPRGAKYSLGAQQFSSTKGKAREICDSPSTWAWLCCKNEYKYCQQL